MDAISDLEKTILVVAHPDDEAIFFSSILECVKRVIVCFGIVPNNQELSKGRLSLALDRLIPRNEYLSITESGSFLSSDWRKPEETDYGLLVDARRSAYIKNFDRLRILLREKLRGYRVIYTHNPWGDYGHEEHVQVYRAVKSLQFELGFEVRVSGYFSDRSASLLSKYSGCLTNGVFAPVNKALAKSLRSTYASRRCWTWDYNYEWPEIEVFYQVWTGDKTVASLLAYPPMNYIHLSETKKEISRGIYRIFSKIAYR